MSLPLNKTKLVCTIGPACESSDMMRQMLRAGMNIARLNFSHGDFSWHARVIGELRDAARAEDKRLTILADLPGPKMRIGQLSGEPVELSAGDTFTLTTDDIIGNGRRVSARIPRLTAAAKPGDRIFLNDGNIQLEVVKIAGNDIDCRVITGGELRSRKGLNLPGMDLGISAFTDRDRECLRFALEQGVDAVGQSFVETAADVEAVRDAASALGRRPFIIAKIERAEALAHMDEILHAADGIMIARGDLGVEIPIERIAVVQKQLIRSANLLGKPAITATQMLGSMVTQSRPTRAEATDVANSVLDGTDCVMLSEESATGKSPVTAVSMLAKIAAATEPFRTDAAAWEAFSRYERGGDTHLVDLMSRNVQHTVAHAGAVGVIVPTATGYNARMLSRFKFPVWIAAVSTSENTCRGLEFSFGVIPVHEPGYPEDWYAFARSWARSQNLEEGLMVLTEGPSPENPSAVPALEIIDLRQKPQKH